MRSLRSTVDVRPRPRHRRRLAPADRGNNLRGPRYDPELKVFRRDCEGDVNWVGFGTASLIYAFGLVYINHSWTKRPAARTSN